jgi:uncharacterized membrane protein YtjA (UPF0391 family)
MQAKKNLVHDRHHRAAAFHPLRFEGACWQRRQYIAIAPAELVPVLDHDPRHLTWRHAALQAKQRHPQFDQMIKPVADAIAAPTTQLCLGERHPELTQIAQLVEQQEGRLLAAREHPRDLPMRQAEIQRPSHLIDVIPHSIFTRGFRRLLESNANRGVGKRELRAGVSESLIAQFGAILLDPGAKQDSRVRAGGSLIAGSNSLLRGQKFPIRLLRELTSNSLNLLVPWVLKTLASGRIEQKFPVFSQLAGNLGPRGIRVTLFSSNRRNQPTRRPVIRRQGRALRAGPPMEDDMLYWALVFFIIAIVAAILGFGGIAATASSIAQILFFVFLVIFLITLVMGVAGRRRPPI